MQCVMVLVLYSRRDDVCVCVCVFFRSVFSCIADAALGALWLNSAHTTWERISITCLSVEIYATDNER